MSPSTESANLAGHRRFIRSLIRIKQSAKAIESTDEALDSAFFVSLSSMFDLTTSSLWNQLLRVRQITPNVKKAISAAIGDPDLSEWVMLGVTSGTLADIPSALRYEVHIVLIDVRIKAALPPTIVQEQWIRTIREKYVKREFGQDRNPQIIVRLRVSEPTNKALTPVTKEVVNYLIHNLTV